MSAGLCGTSCASLVDKEGSPQPEAQQTCLKETTGGEFRVYRLL